ncbi:hypothetical protein AGMMS50268_21150 [Spirochaetia bacterium]|nr:hypothetical protein AGMMS50268_21150 [Spirochaetia bacterium]
MVPLLIAGAAIGAGIGALSTGMQGEKAQGQLGHQKRTAWEQYLLGKDYSDEQYSINRNQAQMQSYIAENRLNQNVDQSIAQMNTGLLSQAYGIQNAQIQTSSSIGASLAAEGAGGTRGNTANGLMRAYEEASLARNIDLQNQQNRQMLTGMTTQAGNALTDIRNERSSWDAGGYRYQQKEAQDTYNRKMAELGQADFDWRIADAAPGPMDYLVNMFSGASSGLSMAGSFSSFGKVGGGKYQKPP